MLSPAMTPQLAHRIEQNDVDYSFARLDGMRRAAGNPLDIEIRQFGSAIAFLIQSWPDFWYGNKVLGLEPASESYLSEIVNFFDKHSLDFRFEIMPGNMNSSLASRLHQLGFCQMSFNTAIYGQPSPAVETPGKGINVRAAEPDELDTFLDLYQDGFGLPRLDGKERQAVLSWLEQASSNLYLCMAQIDDTPAGVGILFIKDGVGLLADAATLPGLRARGCHTAMIYHRIAQAEKRGCDLLTSFVEFGSRSHLNLERAGLHVAYTKAMWWRVG